MSLTHVRWQPCYRIIPARYPPISIYERVADADEFKALVALESRTNRFSDGSYGVYYTSKTLETAICETTYHRERFYRATENNKSLNLDMRVLKAELNGELEDLRNSPDQFLFTDDYSSPQKYARQLKEKGSNGILYTSVRHPKNKAAAVFNPQLLSNCKEDKYLVYEWNGLEINSIYEKKIYF